MDDPRKLTMLSLLMISLMLFCRGYSVWRWRKSSGGYV